MPKKTAEKPAEIKVTPGAVSSEVSVQIQPSEEVQTYAAAPAQNEQQNETAPPDEITSDIQTTSDENAGLDNAGDDQSGIGKSEIDSSDENQASQTSAEDQTAQTGADDTEKDKDNDEVIEEEEEEVKSGFEKISIRALCGDGKPFTGSYSTLFFDPTGVAEVTIADRDSLEKLQKQFPAIEIEKA